MLNCRVFSVIDMLVISGDLHELNGCLDIWEQSLGSWKDAGDSAFLLAVGLLIA